MIRLVHITDPHLTSLHGAAPWRLRGKRWSGYLSWRRRRRHVHLRERLDAVTAAAQAENPVQILVTGDLVHVGLPEEIEQAAAWLEALGSASRVMFVPGNHDDYAGDSHAAMRAHWSDYLPDFPSSRTVERDGVTVTLLGLSSACPTPVFMAQGRLGDEQLRALDQSLAQAPGFRCVLLHHPPLPGGASWRKRLRDAHALQHVLDRHGTELVLHGHVHRNVSTRSAGGVPVFGTASASSSSPPAAYRRIDVARGAGGWQVDMRLISVSAAGVRRELERMDWTVPFRTPATDP